MKVKKYIGRSIKEALLKAKEELGEDLIILKTRKLTKKGFLGNSLEGEYEVIVALDKEITEELEEIKRPVDSFNEENTNNIDSLSSINRKRSYIDQVYKKYSEALKQSGDSNYNQTRNPSSNLRNNNYNNVFSNKEQEEIISKKEDTNINVIKNEIEELKTVVQKLVEISFKENFEKHHENIKKLYLELKDKELDETFIIHLLEKIETVLDKEKLDDYSYLHKVVISNIAAKIKISNEISDIPPKKPFVVVFIGPTGVGKTTTIAKISAISKVLNEKKVALLSLDTYRIAAAEQLKTFADISSIPFQLCYTKENLIESIEKFRTFDYIFIDTAGRSPKNKEHLGEIFEILEGTLIDRRYLLISATTKLQDMIMVYNNFSNLNLDGVIFTKIDETLVLGNIFNFHLLVDLPIVGITNGQSVPDDILFLDAKQIAELILS